MTNKQGTEKCNGAHCKCMDIGGQCPNMHWYHCKEHNPEAYAKGTPRPEKCICNHGNVLTDCYPKTRCACKVHGDFSSPQGDTPEWEEMKGQIAQEILGKLEYRGFYDAGKYLDGDIIEAIEPFIRKLQQEARKVSDETKQFYYNRGYLDGREAERKEIVEAIKKIYISEEVQVGQKPLGGHKPFSRPLPPYTKYTEGFDDALDRILKFITQRGKSNG